MSYDSNILEHYKQVAAEAGLDPSSTMADQKVRQLETELILGVVEQVAARYGPTLDLFDVGCGNGYTLSAVHAKYPELSATGFEFSPELAELARKRFKNSTPDVVIADVRASDWNRGMSAHLVISQRVLINILDRGDQERTLRNLLAAVKPGGYALLIEGFQAGLDNLNQARAEFDLPAIPPAHHNLLLNEELLKTVADISERTVSFPSVPENFLSTHYFAARVLHPLVLGHRGFTRNSEFVRFMSDALRPMVGDYSPVKAVCLQRRG